jgi:putative PIN family toxin of toxin-antitoxin system
MDERILTLVIDSNVLISLLVFGDPRYSGILAAWRAGRVRVVANEDCAREFQRVLGYPQLKLEEARQSAIYEAFRSSVRIHEGESAAAALLPQCLDADDQKFLDLAAACEADFLVTGDRELLKLARRAPFAIVTAGELEKRLAAAAGKP